MRHLRPRKNIKVSKIILIIISLILFLTITFFNTYSQKSTPKIISYSKAKLEKFTKNFLSNNIGFGILNNKNLENILIINKNKNGEILYVDYNLDKAYEALQIITDVLYQNMNDLENGLYQNIYDKELLSINNNLVLKLPFFIGTNNYFLTNFGPKIYLKVDFISAILTNINSKITSYGMNNALVELYVTIEISENLTTPIIEENLTFTYDVLIASKVINGRVPEIYGGIMNNDLGLTNTS